MAMAMAKEWETKYGTAIRNDQMEGYLKKEIQNLFHVRTILHETIDLWWNIPIDVVVYSDTFGYL